MLIFGLAVFEIFAFKERDYIVLPYRGCHEKTNAPNEFIIFILEIKKSFLLNKMETSINNIYFLNK